MASAQAMTQAIIQVAIVALTVAVQAMAGAELKQVPDGKVR